MTKLPKKRKIIGFEKFKNASLGSSKPRVVAKTGINKAEKERGIPSVTHRMTIVTKIARVLWAKGLEG
jgi:hypothetical protein